MKRTNVVMLFLMAFFVGTPSVFSAEVVKFGVTEIQSGAFKPVGDRQIWGIETAVKETNDAGGLLGKRIELVIEDKRMRELVDLILMTIAPETWEINDQGGQGIIFPYKGRLVVRNSRRVHELIAGHQP